uniref:Uncharacterized protein n=4 Tax=Lotharella globosa TaxID=91324 RepID=A0A7S3YS03_9EUKA|mmetsp:Transcript_8826/g.17232  ORF Transcript_8826/g.17232 Transcript_8826/m.17232 type:complete len:351 (-) Transcript_8826:127-1179(-)|eukprot:CAMPEP_0167784102 /NCGR_PEP_ID=MMETSP0111_2-20121227/7446_1 /TAXON_ID=91324 /ORGANISM="Lotharella globosa, Strain CCCM811" /LENGTH=350 /DNA_ID=CAMNT_0007675127 /DNA_START=156 /DNA_END=1208 /DNA_ORIENTATION=-
MAEEAKTEPALSQTFAVLAVQAEKIGGKRVAFNNRSLDADVPIIVTNIERVDPPSRCACSGFCCLTTLLCCDCMCCCPVEVEYFEAETLTMEEFATAISEMKEVTDVMLFIHGYTLQPSDVLSLKGGCQDIQDSYLPNILVVPVIWSSVMMRKQYETTRILGWMVDRSRASTAAKQIGMFFSQATAKCKESKVVADVFQSGMFHLYAHSMGTYVFFRTAEAFSEEDLTGGFKFGLVVIKQGNAPPDWFQADSNNFKNSGSKVVHMGKRLLITYATEDTRLNQLENIKLATKIYGHNNLGALGPGDTKHIPNIKVVNSAALMPDLENYHCFHKNEAFVKLIKENIEQVRIS